VTRAANHEPHAWVRRLIPLPADRCSGRTAPTQDTLGDPGSSRRLPPSSSALPRPTPLVESSRCSTAADVAQVEVLPDPGPERLRGGVRVLEFILRARAVKARVAAHRGVEIVW
jgi:hypothetical protein